MPITLTIMNDLSEVVQSYLPDVNIAIQQNKLSDFTAMQALCHWHDDIEIIKILDGEMNFYINGETVLLQKNEGIIINSRMMHYGYSASGQDCTFICILINPMIFDKTSTIYKKFVLPVITSTHIKQYALSPLNPQHQTLLSTIQHLADNYLLQPKHSPLQSIAFAYQFWHEWFSLLQADMTVLNDSEDTDTVLQKKMTTFIYSNYMHTITLDDIAASANICRSRCCKLFKRFARLSPIAYLNAYRMEKSKILLSKSQLSITEIAIKCGFNSPSYFSKQFYTLNQCTPKAYRGYNQTIVD